MNDLISIIINVYNGEKYINKCLDSVINQTYKNIEILIINDGSTDNTLKICKSYKDKRIRIITTPNEGLSISRNTGISNAKGKYIYFIDVDDYIEKDTIEYLYNLINKYNTRISMCRNKKIYSYNTRISNLNNNDYLLSSKDVLKRVLLSINYAGTAWNKLIDKELFNNLKFPKGKINDVYIMYKLYFKVDNIAYGNQIKYYYYMHEDSIVNKRTTDYAISMYKAFNKRYKDIKKKYPNLIENNICILLFIIDLYIHDNKEIHDYLNREECINKYNNMFKLNYLFINIGIKNKIKLLLFRISPRLYIKVVSRYLKLKKLR
jgi:glycosyltransferase involved in cell wall biosynthesis